MTVPQSVKGYASMAAQTTSVILHHHARRTGHAEAGHHPPHHIHAAPLSRNQAPAATDAAILEQIRRPPLAHHAHIQGKAARIQSALQHREILATTIMHAPQEILTQYFQVLSYARDRRYHAMTIISAQTTGYAAVLQGAQPRQMQLTGLPAHPEDRLVHAKAGHAPQTRRRLQAPQEALTLK